MSIPTSPVLEHAIAQLEAQLAQLKKDQTLLLNLNARKEELQKELHRVNAQIAKVTGKVAPATPTPLAAPAAKPTPTPPVAAKVAKPAPGPAKAATPKAAAGAKPSLADLIVACLKEAKGKPVGVKQLTDLTLKRGFTTTSSTPYRIVESRIQDLSKIGVVAHAKGQPGWVLGKGISGAVKPTAAKASKNGVAKVAPSAKKDNTPAKGRIKGK